MDLQDCKDQGKLSIHCNIASTWHYGFSLSQNIWDTLLSSSPPNGGAQDLVS